MENTSKKTLGIVGFLPLVAWVICLIYFLVINGRLITTQTFQQHDQVVTNVAANFTMMNVLFLVAMTITAIVLCMYVVHLAKLKSMNGATKAAWIVFLLVFEFVAFPVLWFMEIKKEPKNVDMYPSID